VRSDAGAEPAELVDASGTHAGAQLAGGPRGTEVKA